MKVQIEREVHEKIMHWVNKSTNEVSGLGKLRFDLETKSFVVLSAILLPQRNGAAHTDIEAEDVAKAMFLMKDEPGDLRFWWHSHVQMPVFWSGTDTDTIKQLGEHGWFLSTVFNQKNEMRSAYYSATGKTGPWGELPIWEDGLETVIGAVSSIQTTAWDEEYDKNVLPPKKAWEGNRHFTRGKRGRGKGKSMGETIYTQKSTACLDCGYLPYWCQCEGPAQIGSPPEDHESVEPEVCPTCYMTTTCRCDSPIISVNDWKADEPTTPSSTESDWIAQAEREGWVRIESGAWVKRGKPKSSGGVGL